MAKFTFPQNCFIHETSRVHHNVVIEPGVYIGPFCLIGWPGEKTGFEDVSGRVIVKKGARIEGFVSIDSGTEGHTVVGSYCHLMKHSHIGHDAILHERVTLSPGAKIGGHCIIEKGCNFGLNSAIHQCVHLPPYCMVGMGAVIVKPKTPYLPLSKYVGVPAKWLAWNEPAKKRFNLSPQDLEQIFDGYEVENYHPLPGVG